MKENAIHQNLLNLKIQMSFIFQKFKISSYGIKNSKLQNNGQIPTKSTKNC